MQILQRRWSASVLGLIFLAPAALPARGWADEVHTADGSRLVGVIELWADGKVTIVTDFAGRLEIDAAKVVALSSAKPLNIELLNGDRLVGLVSTAADPGSCEIQTDFGSVPFKLDQIRTVWPQGAMSPEEELLRQAVEAQAAAMKPQWTLTMEAGGTATEGNTETLNARGRFEVKRKTAIDLLRFYVAADYSEQDDTRSKNEYRGGISYEKQINDRSYWYARTELERDEFESLDLRTTASVGMGRYWLKSDAREFKTRIGVGYRHEAFEDGVTRDDPVVDLGFDLRLDVAPAMQVTHSTTYGPDLEDFDAYRLDVDSALTFPLKSEDWKLKVGMRHEYNSRPLNDLKRLDTTYYANIVLEITN